MARTADRKLQRSDRVHFRRADGITIGKGNGSVHGIFERRNFKDSETGNGEGFLPDERPPTAGGFYNRGSSAGVGGRGQRKDHGAGKPNREPGALR